MRLQHIGIIGTGGVGGYFGGKLARSMQINPDLNFRVYFVARGSHLDEIRRHGLILSTSDEGDSVCYPTEATDRIENLPHLDLCLLCVKSYDLHAVLNRLVPVIHDQTRIIPLLNGVDIVERIRSVIETGVVFPGCVYVGTHIEKPGMVVQNGGTCEILFGKDPAHDDIVPREIFELFDRSRIKYSWLNRPYPEIWEKFMFIAAYGLVGAATGKTLGTMMTDVPAKHDVRSVMQEIELLARISGIGLRESIVDESFEKAGQFPCESKCSFQRDFEDAGKPDERDLFGGTLVRMAESQGVDVPVTRRILMKLDSIKPAICP
ncbi:2-dehydropantoate 2-reductase [bacterium]|nr:2-dehydropantoate 2-reductase [bacterium]